MARTRFTRGGPHPRGPGLQRGGRDGLDPHDDRLDRPARRPRAAARAPRADGAAPVPLRDRHRALRAGRGLRADVRRTARSCSSRRRSTRRAPERRRARSERVATARRALEAADAGQRRGARAPPPICAAPRPSSRIAGGGAADPAGAGARYVSARLSMTRAARRRAGARVSLAPSRVALVADDRRGRRRAASRGRRAAPAGRAPTGPAGSSPPAGATRGSTATSPTSRRHGSSRPATCTPGVQTFAAFWVGLGGYANNSKALEQIGTEVDCRARRQPLYYAWYEFVPRPFVTIHTLKISPGDEITAIVHVSGNHVKVWLRDVTSGGAAFVKNRVMSCARCPTPAPPTGSPRRRPTATATTVATPLRLTDFGTVTFTARERDLDRQRRSPPRRDRRPGVPAPVRRDRPAQQLVPGRLAEDRHVRAADPARDRRPFLQRRLRSHQPDGPQRHDGHHRHDGRQRLHRRHGRDRRNMTVPARVAARGDLRARRRPAAAGRALTVLRVAERPRASERRASGEM